MIGNIFEKIKSGNLEEIANTLNTVLNGSAKTSKKYDQNTYTTNSQNTNNSLGANAIGELIGTLFRNTARAGGTTKSRAGATAASMADLAWKFYQKWEQNEKLSQKKQKSQQNSQNIPSQPTLENQQAEKEGRIALVLVEAMVYAARADGNVGDDEVEAIHNAVEALFPNQQISDIIKAFLDVPIDPYSLAAKVSSKEEACDIYKLSCAAVDIDSFMERSYLDALAVALKLSSSEKAALEKKDEQI